MTGTLVVQVVRPRTTVVAINEHVRTPCADHIRDVVGDRGLFELHVVAVHVDAPRIATRTELRRLESVRIDLRRDHDRHLVEEVVGCGARRGQVAHQNQQALSEGPLAAVDVRRQDDDRPAERPCFPGLTHQRTTVDGVG